jgi:RnfABCDGE-type electron transport complex B subunit
MTLLIPVIIIGGLGLLYGIGLAIASVAFHVEVDPRVEKIMEALPGANCGACGKPGCGGYAEAIVVEGASINMCAPGGAETAKKIAEIMGAVAGETVKKIAYIHCSSGGKNNTRFKYEYEGVPTCKAAVMVANGPNMCAYGCVGYNDCMVACPFDAITLDENNNRIIDVDKCTACGACVRACPRGLIEIVKLSQQVKIQCSNKEKGIAAKNNCGTTKGCIACGLCAKVCPVEAITMENNLAVINYEKCIDCGMCATKCPTKAIEDQMAGKRKKARIIDEKCIGCTICAKKCPVQAITGELKQLHHIDEAKCVGCEICFEKCPKKAIEMV